MGLTAVIAYWLSLAPEGLSYLGFSEDLGLMELVRHLIADGIQRTGWPEFQSTRIFAPEGGSLLFMGPSLERDWLGAYAALWDPAFPWLWVYAGLSLLLTYVIVGVLAAKIATAQTAAWMLAAVFVCFNPARHFKAFHHFDFTIQHWLVFGLLMEVWIWKRWRERGRWAMELEAWRMAGFLALAGTSGYWWGPSFLLWGLVRAVMGWQFFGPRASGAVGRRRFKDFFEWPASSGDESSRRWWIAPGFFGAVFLVLDALWFSRLAPEAFRVGAVFHGVGNYWNPLWILQPLVLEPVQIFGRTISLMRSAGAQETLIQPGWTLLIPMMTAVWAARVQVQPAGGGVWAALKPFWIFGIIMLLFPFHPVGIDLKLHELLATVVPFMSYFRTLVRAGLWMPWLVLVVLLLLWDPWTAWLRARWSDARLGSHRVRQRVFIGGVLFLSISAVEARLFRVSPTGGPALSTEQSRFFESLRSAPGTTVLNLPFCLASGTGMCTAELCPFWPQSITPMELTTLHHKAVYGYYVARVTETQCDRYRGEPYRAWMNAWRENRCFTGAELDALCAHLDHEAERGRPHAATLVFPGVWTAAAAPACRAGLESRLGPAVDQTQIMTRFGRTPRGDLPTEVIRYAGRCVSRR